MGKLYYGVKIMAQKRIGNDTSRDLGRRKNILKEKHKGKRKDQLTNADVFEYVKEIMANEFKLSG